MEKIKEFFNNKWVRFSLATIIYVLWFVVWTGNWWLLLGIGVIYDLYISKYFYRYVWSKNEKLCEKSALYRDICDWGNAIVFATVVATLIHIFIFQMYVIPSSSMEKSLLVGDYLYVSKVTYGPQMPNTPLSFPTDFFVVTHRLRLTQNDFIAHLLTENFNVLTYLAVVEVIDRTTAIISEVYIFLR